MKKYSSRSEVPDKYKWDLSDFFKNEEDFNNNYEIAKKLIDENKNFINCTKDSNKLYEFIIHDEKTNSIIENLYVYAYLKNDEELGNSKSIDRKNKAISLITNYSTSVSFFNPELLKLDKDSYEKLFDNKKLLDYKFMLDEIYKNKEHVLSEKEEIIINELESAMNNFDDISSTMLNSEHDYGTVKIDNEDVQIRQTNLRKLLKNDDRNIRKEVSFKYKSTLDKYGQTSASLLDSFVKANNVNAKLHNFKNAWDRKLFDYNMPQKAYDALVNVTLSNTDSLQRYYKLFKERLNLDELHDYDLNMDITRSNKSYTIEDGLELIKNSLSILGDEYIKCYEKIIDKHYIDFCEYKGKCSGGYSLNSSDHDSRILLSFNDDLESISTIAHECGHNVHHQFVQKYNPIQYRNITTLVAEVVSLTNECLLSSYLATNGKTKEERLEGIDNILGVIVSNLFGAVREAKMESDFYNYSLEGNAITKDYMNNLDRESLKKFYGDTIVLDDYSHTGWIRRSHYYMDYYLYNYAFCISVASSVASKILSNDKKMLENYIKFISLGSDIYPIDAFKVLGIDITDEKVYKDAINYFNSLIDEFEKISKE